MFVGENLSLGEIVIGKILIGEKSWKNEKSWKIFYFLQTKYYPMKHMPQLCKRRSETIISLMLALELDFFCQKTSKYSNDTW